ncbi:MAG: nitroreductase family protein [Phycisphaerae bacterium]|nr:nitroreductase family protein [Phycisphaerae bacterium]
MNIHEIIRNRRSVRKYAQCPIEPEKKQLLMDALRLAPTACNFQPFKFIVIEDSESIKTMAQLCKSQSWIAQAPMIIIGCAIDKNAYKKMGNEDNSSDIDVTIALDHLTLAAVDLGLGTCWIGAFDKQAVRKFLNIPEDVNVTAIIPVGYPETPDLNFPVDESKRKTENELFCQENWK